MTNAGFTLHILISIYRKQDSSEGMTSLLFDTPRTFMTVSTSTSVPIYSDIPQITNQVMSLLTKLRRPL